MNQGFFFHQERRLKNKVFFFLCTVPVGLQVADAQLLGKRCGFLPNLGHCFPRLVVTLLRWGLKSIHGRLGMLRAS